MIRVLSGIMILGVILSLGAGCAKKAADPAAPATVVATSRSYYADVNA